MGDLKLARPALPANVVLPDLPREFEWLVRAGQSSLARIAIQEASRQGLPTDALLHAMQEAYPQYHKTQPRELPRNLPEAPGFLATLRERLSQSSRPAADESFWD